MSKQKIICVVGPTASGKSTLGIEVAKRFGGEVLSVDSRQIYVGIDVGTAKLVPDKKEGGAYIVDGIAHYGLDLAQPDEPFTVMDFKDYAQGVIADMAERGHVPVLVGGTGVLATGYL